MKIWLILIDKWKYVINNIKAIIKLIIKKTISALNKNKTSFNEIIREYLYLK